MVAMTNLYLDTEFNGFGGELISMALVPDDGRAPFYQVAQIPAKLDPWVAEHVIPLLGQKPIGLATFRRAFHNYVTAFDRPTVVCDWHADAEHFCRTLAGEAFGSSLDFECLIKILKTPPGQPKPKLPHNALSDATALMEWHSWSL